MNEQRNALELLWMKTIFNRVNYLINEKLKYNGWIRVIVLGDDLVEQIRAVGNSFQGRNVEVNHQNTKRFLQLHGAGIVFM